MTIATIETIPVAYPEPNDDGRVRHLLFVRLTTDDGQVGWGEAVTMWPEASLATQALVQGLAPLVVGREPADHAEVYDGLAEHMWWYGVGGIASFALSALDIALWDLAGKAAGRPLLEMVGGAAHESLPVLVSCHAMEADLERMAATMAGWVATHDAIGIKLAFGKRGDARLGYDRERDRRFVSALRRELGPDKAIMIDIGAALHWDVPTAIDRTAMLEDFGIAWIEEPLGADDPEGYAELRSKATTKIAYGEREWTARGVQRIVATSTVDVVGVDPGRCEGITGWLKAQQHTALAGVEINAHAWSSAIVTAASLALSLASPNAHQIEIKPLRNPMQHELVASPIAPVGGRLSALSAPGLGIAVDEEVLRRYVFSGH
jgi:L-alanine-DL-glutamate epimerase-like enolase superfamily enzyme